MTNADAAVAAGLLRQLRESRGWSWADLARALRDIARQLTVTSLEGRQVASIQRTVARWESPTDRTSPGERYQLLLAHLYARSTAGMLELGPGSDFAVLADALHSIGVPEHRLRTLTEMVAGDSPNHRPQNPVTATLRRSPAHLDDDLINQLASTVTTINAQVGSTPLVRLQLALAPTVETCRELIDPTQPPPRDEVLILTTNTLSLAARLAFETTDDETAVKLYREATDAGSRLRDRRHRAAILTSYAMVTLHATGDLHRTHRIAHAAVTDAHRSGSHAHRARAHAVHAEVSARSGHARRAYDALDDAWAAIDQLPADQRPTGFNADRLDGFDGLCALHLGSSERAHDRLERSLATLNGPREAVQRGIVSTDLALARLRLGDPTACTTLLHNAVEVAATTGGRVPAQRIRHTRRALRQSRSDTAVAELDDHIHERLIGR